MSMLGINCYKPLKGMQFIFFKFGLDILLHTCMCVGVEVDIGLFQVTYGNQTRQLLPGGLTPVQAADLYHTLFNCEVSCYNL